MKNTIIKIDIWLTDPEADDAPLSKLGTVAVQVAGEGSPAEARALALDTVYGSIKLRAQYATT